MRSKRSREGELMIDHRASPGLTAEQVNGFGPVVGKGQFYESATYICRHCQFEVVINPKRDRERGWCPKCDSYLCDECEYLRSVTFECRDVERRADHVINLLETQGSSALLVSLLKGQL